MEIREWHSSMAKEWDDFVHFAPNGSLFHTTRWKNVLERTFNYRPVLLSVYERDHIVGVLPLFWVPKPQEHKRGSRQRKQEDYAKEAT